MLPSDPLGPLCGRGELIPVEGLFVSLTCSRHEPEVETSGTEGSSCGQGYVTNGSSRTKEAMKLPEAAALSPLASGSMQRQVLVTQPPGPVAERAARSPKGAGCLLEDGEWEGASSLALILLWIH